MNEAQTQYIAAVVGVLKQHAMAAGLSDRVMQRIAVEALAGGHLQDAAWLEGRLQAIDFDDETAQGDDDDPLHGGGDELDAAADDEDEGGADEESEGGEAKPAAQLPVIHVSPPLVITSQEELDAAVARHREWMESVLDPQKYEAAGRANFRGANLSGLNLQGVNLSCADFSNANLAGTALSYANLSRCKFTQASLEGADLRGAKLKKASFRDANLRQANLQDTDLRDADLGGAVLDEAKLPPDSALL